MRSFQLRPRQGELAIGLLTWFSFFSSILDSGIGAIALADAVCVGIRAKMAPPADLTSIDSSEQQIPGVRGPLSDPGDVFNLLISRDGREPLCGLVSVPDLWRKS